jgi:hypothetical protein
MTEPNLALFKSPSASIRGGLVELLLEVCYSLTSGYVRKNWSVASRHSTPKTTKRPHLMFRNAGGMNSPMAKLKSQLPMAA